MLELVHHVLIQRTENTTVPCANQPVVGTLVALKCHCRQAGQDLSKCKGPGCGWLLHKVCFSASVGKRNDVAAESELLGDTCPNVVCAKACFIARERSLIDLGPKQLHWDKDAKNGPSDFEGSSVSIC